MNGNGPPPEVAAGPPGSRPSRQWPRILGSIAAIALLAASITLIIIRRDMLRAALASLAHPSAQHVAALAASVVVGMALTGLLFSVLMSRYGRVGLLEMQALLAASTLVNFLPLRPGLFGRVVYHRAVNRIAPIDSARTIIQAAALSVAVAGYLAGAVLVSVKTGSNLWAAALAPLPVLTVAACARRPRIIAIAATIRFVEVLVWSARYWAAFALIGSPIDAHAALALACVSMIANLVPFFGNGLGLREWAIGLAAPLLVGCKLELGVTAELVNRAVEMVVVLVMGLAGAGYLTFLRRRLVAT
jgi:hypothetical protein